MCIFSELAVRWALYRALRTDNEADVRARPFIVSLPVLCQAPVSGQFKYLFALHFRRSGSLPRLSLGQGAAFV